MGVFNASTSPLNTAPQITGPLATTLPTALAAVQKVRHARERASRLVLSASQCSANPLVICAPPARMCPRGERLAQVPGHTAIKLSERMAARGSVKPRENACISL